MNDRLSVCFSLSTFKHKAESTVVDLYRLALYCVKSTSSPILKSLVPKGPLRSLSTGLTSTVQVELSFYLKK